jgi:hypothetical protein
VAEERPHLAHLHAQFEERAVDQLPLAGVGPAGGLRAGEREAGGGRDAAEEGAERLGRELVAPDEHGGLLGHVSQFAHVAGPVVPTEEVARVRRQPQARGVVLLGVSVEVVLEDGDDVLAPLPQRGDVEDDGREAVVEVLAEAPLAHLLRQVLVRRRDDPHVGPERLRGAHAAELPALEHPEEPDLRLQRHLADLVEEDRPAVGLLEVARAALDGAGVGPLLGAEQLALDEALGDGPAVDHDHPPVATRRQLVDGVGDELLADAALAFEQHGDVHGGHLPHAVDDAAEGGGVAEKAEALLEGLAVHGGEGGERGRRR